MSITVQVNDRGARLRLGKLAEAVSLPSVHRIVGQVMQGSIDQTFDQEGFPAGSWRRLHASTLQAQFTRGNEARKNKRGIFTKSGRQTRGFLRFASGKKILTDSGRLRNSITNESRGSQLVIGTNLIYARVQQEGGVIRPKRPGGVLAFPGGAGGTIFARRVVIPPRPYLLIKPDDPPKMARAIEAAAGAD